MHHSFRAPQRVTQRVHTWIVLAALLVPQAAAQAPMTPEHIARLRAAGSVAISPDGAQIAYTLSVPRLPGKDADGAAWSELHVCNPAGQSRPFINGAVNIGSVQWTPDGAGISFLAKLGDDKERCLYVIPVDGGQARRVATFETGIAQYAWSPDGRRAALIATPKADKQRESLKKKGFKHEVYEEDWRAARVYLIDMPQAGQPAAAVKSEPLALDGHATEVAWSPDGKLLAVKLSRSPLVDDVMMFTRIHLIDADSGADVARMQTAGKLGPMAFSPDGAHLAWIGAEDINDPSEGRLFVAGTSGGAARDLLPGYMGHVVELAWQNAETVMYIGHEGVWSSFGKVNVDGSDARQIVPPAAGPVWHALSLARDGQSGAISADAPDHPREVFHMKHGDAAPTRLTNSNPWLRDVQLARREVVRHQARDGLELEGILVYPLNHEPGARVPLVLMVHGGPEAHVWDGWNTTYSRPDHVLAARGIASFFPNYRGSTGRGVAFSKLGQGDAAGREFDDLVDAVDHFVETGLADKARIGVTGGSYGGYATAWCSTRYSERFAAGVMFVGISDKIAKFGTTDIAQEEYLVHARKWPWENWDYARERSPVHYVTQARTPLLIMHGKDDPRVHPSQSLILYRYLKTATQTPVRLIWYPGEGHGNAKAAARYDYCLRTLQWLEHYLTGPGGAAPAKDLDYALDAFGAADDATGEDGASD